MITDRGRRIIIIKFAYICRVLFYYNIIYTISPAELTTRTGHGDICLKGGQKFLRVNNNNNNMCVPRPEPIDTMDRTVYLYCTFCTHLREIHVLRGARGDVQCFMSTSFPKVLAKNVRLCCVKISRWLWSQLYINNAMTTTDQCWTIFVLYNMLIACIL